MTGTTTIKLNGRIFRRHGYGWQMGTVADHAIDITFDLDSTFEWAMLAAALDEIERLTPENVEEPSHAPNGPHSRACGWRYHPHGSACHSNCPTCGGRPLPPENVEGPT